MSAAAMTPEIVRTIEIDHAAEVQVVNTGSPLSAVALQPDGTRRHRLALGCCRCGM